MCAKNQNFIYYETEEVLYRVSPLARRNTYDGLDIISLLMKENVFFFLLIFNTRLFEKTIDYLF